jgi:alpha-beta hydrolase superfamily lysophospholipase
MIRNETHMRTRDGLRLHARRWSPGEEERGAVCLVHGLGEHGGRYERLAAALTGAGYSLMAADLRGHGRSEGRRGHIGSYEHLMEDIELLLEETELASPGAPLFLFGQSMGGNLVINFALRRRPALAGVIASSPMLRTAFAPPGWKTFLGKRLRGFLPALPLGNEIRADDLSRDLSVVDAYRRDPLNHDRLTLAFQDVLLAGEWAIEHAEGLSLPLLLMHGDADRIASHEASAEFAGRAGDRCTFRLWEGLRHELHNEPEGRQVGRFVLEWMNGGA